MSICWRCRHVQREAASIALNSWSLGPRVHSRPLHGGPRYLSHRHHRRRYEITTLPFWLELVDAMPGTTWLANCGHPHSRARRQVKCGDATTSRSPSRLPERFRTRVWLRTKSRLRGSGIPLFDHCCGWIRLFRQRMTGQDSDVGGVGGSSSGARRACV